jgi:hypothetical protein
MLLQVPRLPLTPLVIILPVAWDASWANFAVPETLMDENKSLVFQSLLMNTNYELFPLG